MSCVFARRNFTSRQFQTPSPSPRRKKHVCRPYVRAVVDRTYVVVASSLKPSDPQLTMASISVSKSTLFHASLAYMSREIQTLDSIISTAYCTSDLRLPTEILLLIRTWLSVTITTHLIQRSSTALEAYEQSLCELLCADCIAYNLDIYGPDIWQWEQFSGACACSQDDKVEDPHLYTTNPGLHGQGRYYSKTPTNTAILNPKQFVDTEHWLEFYLSREVASTDLYSGHHGYLEPRAASIPATRPPVGLKGDIWDVVDTVLREHNCEAIREPEDRVHMHNRIHFGRGQFHTKHDFVQVTALPGHVYSNNPKHDGTLELTAQEDVDLNWRAQVILRRVSRDLCLLHDFTDFCNTRSGHHCVPIIARRLRWPGVTNTCYSCRDASVLLNHFFKALASLAAISLSLPLAVITIALTVLCFYSKPRSFRIL